MDSKRKVSKLFNSNPQASQLWGWPKSRWWYCVQTDVNKFIITKWKERPKTELNARVQWVGEVLKLNGRAIKEKEENILHNTNPQWNSFVNNMWTLRIYNNFGLIMETEEVSGV